MRKRLVAWLVIGAVVLFCWAVTGSLVPESSLTALIAALSVLWLVISTVVGLWLLWRRLTYRVSVRLLLSYLLIGVSPFLFCALFAGFVLYLLMGQYTSVRFGTEMEAVARELRRDCQRLLETFGGSGINAAEDLFEDLSRREPQLFPRVLWRARFNGFVLNGESAIELPGLGWVAEDLRAVVRHESGVYLLDATTDRGGLDLAAVLIPLDQTAARAISSEMWFDAFFLPLDEVTGEAKGSNEFTVDGANGSSRRFTFDDRGTPLDQVWEDWPEAERGLLWKPWIYWFRLTEDVRNLNDGEPADSLVTLLRTSPANVWRDFILWHYEFGNNFWAVLAGLGTFFLVVYGLAVLLAMTMMISITRSTSRLTRGARELEEGNLDYRIPVRRRDQLGDLAQAFNRMTASIQDMMLQVADRERLARELELAREIQQSLLPDRHVRHGPLTVHATFRPATEVGGDYFDIFPFGDGRLVVVVGDVAGHGLHTGLLMASLKSSVAALVHEGYGGSELLRRVSRLLVGDASGRTMATLAVVEIDPPAQRLRLTTAGHPPAYLVNGGACEELMASSLPLGSPLFEPVQAERPFPSDCLLVLYSDGLVEATNAEGEPFGYDRLAALLAGSRLVGGGELAATVLASLDRFVGGGPLEDDLTLVVVENGKSGVAM